LCSSSNTVNDDEARDDKIDGTYITRGTTINSYKISAEKPEENVSLLRYKHLWGYNVKRSNF
jgi:hypothetical protein